MKKIVILLLVIIVGIVIINNAKNPTVDTSQDPVTTEFQNPTEVVVIGYNGNIMEPFVSRDGAYVFFNNENAPSANTNLHYAVRVDDKHYTYKGEVGGINTESLDAVASMDNENNLYFITTRSYFDDYVTVYRGKFLNGAVTNVQKIGDKISKNEKGWLNMDAEISADGQTLYYNENLFGGGGLPKTSVVKIARKQADGTFAPDTNSDKLLKSVNDPAGLEYAPATSADEKEFYFTRGFNLGSSNEQYRMYVAKRNSLNEPFGAPLLIPSIEGLIEGPTLSSNGRLLYFHKKVNGLYKLFVVTRE